MQYYKGEFIAQLTLKTKCKKMKIEKSLCELSAETLKPLKSDNSSFFIKMQRFSKNSKEDCHFISFRHFIHRHYVLCPATYIKIFSVSAKTRCAHYFQSIHLIPYLVLLMYLEMNFINEKSTKRNIHTISIRTTSKKIYTTIL